MARQGILIDDDTFDTDLGLRQFVADSLFAPGLGFRVLEKMWHD